MECIPACVHPSTQEPPAPPCSILLFPLFLMISCLSRALHARPHPQIIREALNFLVAVPEASMRLLSDTLTRTVLQARPIVTSHVSSHSRGATAGGHAGSGSAMTACGVGSGGAGGGYAGSAAAGSVGGSDSQLAALETVVQAVAGFDSRVMEGEGEGEEGGVCEDEEREGGKHERGKVE